MRHMVRVVSQLTDQPRIILLRILAEGLATIPGLEVDLARTLIGGWAVQEGSA